VDISPTDIFAQRQHVWIARSTQGVRPGASIAAVHQAVWFHSNRAARSRFHIKALTAVIDRLTEMGATKELTSIVRQLTRLAFRATPNKPPPAAA
jgi:hypothetical protein